jgi:hypothetical protein
VISDCLLKPGWRIQAGQGDQLGLFLQSAIGNRQSKIGNPLQLSIEGHTSPRPWARWD